jgi:hypothetical protein
MLEVAKKKLLDNKAEVMTYFINDENMKNCPHIDVKIGNENVKGVIDTGSEISLITEDLYAHLRSQGVEMMELTLQSTVLVTAFGSRSRRIKKQVFVPFFIGDDCFEHVFLVSGQLIETVLIGADFLQEYGLVINFKTNCLMYEREGDMKECKFTKKGEAKLEPRANIGHSLPQTADHDVMQTTHDESIWTMRKYVAFVNRSRDLYDELMEEEDTNPLDISMKGNGKENTPCVSEVLREYKNDLIEFNACGKADDFKGMKRKEKEVDYNHQERSGGESRLRLDLWDKGGADLRDPRQVSEVDLKKLIMNNNNLELQQKEKLIEVLLRYTEFFTTRPGKCKVYEYNFNITDTTPIIGHSRPVPYSVRAGVRKQIEQMMEDGILELSDSSFINPLTIVHRENKEPRICIDARRVNNVMLPDRARAPPIDEMLQQFHGVKYMTSLDLTSAFLQIPLEESSRKYTAFLFDTNVYQFQRVPFGTKNSLAAFVRGLRKVLGSDVNSFCACYVDDIVIFSKTFHEHLEHINLIFKKLTTAGFTTNALKCKFCQPQMNFLGHV